MRLYRVYVADKLTKFPLAYYDIKAWSKRGAERKIFKQVCEKAISYLVTAKLIK